MAELDLFPAIEAAARAYDRATYGEVAAEHSLGLVAAVAAAAPLIEAEVRRKVAEEIRAYADEIATKAEATAGVAAGTADDHPFVLGLGFAANIAEQWRNATARIAESGGQP